MEVTCRSSVLLIADQQQQHEGGTQVQDLLATTDSILQASPETATHTEDGFKHFRNFIPHNSGRQVCKHNSLATKAPLVAAQWDYEANDGTPDNVVAQSNHLAHWHCKALYPETATEWDYSENQGQPSHHPASSHHLAWWFSPQRGSWQQTIAARTSVVQQKRARLKRVQERHFSTGLKPGPTEV
ncbi:hypothetical protein ABBQ38_011116 [Trebouxia sp. C0009 RCD-2024]